MGTNLEKLTRIVHAATSMTLLGGGFVRQTDLKTALSYSEILICADGGANFAFDWGIQPTGIIGDLDSVNVDQAKQRGVPMAFVDDQNSTDLEKCLNHLDAPFVLGVGFLGFRFDHSLAALNALCKHPGRAVILMGVEDLVFRVPDHLVLMLKAGTRVSLFPFTPVEAESTGLRWPLKGLEMTPNGQIGCSNAAIGDVVEIDVCSGDLIAIVPRETLPQIVSALG